MAKKQKKQIVCSQHPANLLNIKDVASLLSVSTDTVRRYFKTGIFPEPICVGGKLLRWREADVIKWSEQLDVLPQE